MPLFIIFIVIPLLEIAVFIEVGSRIGLGMTLFLTFLTAVIGASLLRYQGLGTWARAQDSLRHDKLPLQEVFDGLCLLVAGATLLTPGFVTDTIGFLLFIPPVRKWLFNRVKSLKDHGYFRMDMHYHGQRWDMKNSSPDIIDVEYHTVEEHEISPDNNRDNGDSRPDRS